MAQTALTSHSSNSLFQNVFILIVSTLILPASLLGLFYNYAALALCPQNRLRRHVHRSSRFVPRKIVITGISTPAGLRAARALHATGHNIVGVEERGLAVLNPARWSNVVSKLYILRSTGRAENTTEYAEGLFKLIVKERANLWIDCSFGGSTQRLAQAKRIVEDRSSCRCLVPNVDQIRRFETRRGFQQLAHQLGLPSPENHDVNSRHDIYNVLNESNGKKYVLSSPNGTSRPVTRHILPKRTVSQTYADVAQLKVSKVAPWTLEQYTAGLPQFTACAVVIQGKAKAFAASSVTDSGDAKAVSSTSGLFNAMKQYLDSFASALGSEFTSHLTMDFCLEEKSTQAGVVQQILPLSGHLAAHDSLLLFEGKRGSVDLTKAYMSLLSTATTKIESYTGLPQDDPSMEVLVPAEPDLGVYFLHQDLVGLVLAPLGRLLLWRSSVQTLVRSWVTFLQHLVAWQEALYDFGDPLPLFCYVHVYAPCGITMDFVQKAWSRISSLQRRVDSGRKELQNGY